MDNRATIYIKRIHIYIYMYQALQNHPPIPGKSEKQDSGRETKGAVYKIPCRDCDQLYIGETGRTMKKRIAEPKQAVRRADDSSSHPPT